MRRNPRRGSLIEATLARMDDIAEEIVMSTRKITSTKDPEKIHKGDIEDLGVLLDTLDDLYDQLETYASSL